MTNRSRFKGSTKKEAERRGSILKDVSSSVSAVQEEGDGGRAAAEQNRDDAAEQPAAGGRTEAPGAVAGGRGLEGKAETSQTDRDKTKADEVKTAGCDC